MSSSALAVELCLVAGALFSLFFIIGRFDRLMAEQCASDPSRVRRRAQNYSSRKYFGNKRKSGLKFPSGKTPAEEKISGPHGSNARKCLQQVEAENYAENTELAAGPMGLHFHHLHGASN